MGAGGEHATQTFDPVAQTGQAKTVMGWVIRPKAGTMITHDQGEQAGDMDQTDRHPQTSAGCKFAARVYTEKAFLRCAI